MVIKLLAYFALNKTNTKALRNLEYPTSYTQMATIKHMTQSINKQVTLNPQLQRWYKTLLINCLL